MFFKVRVVSASSGGDTKGPLHSSQDTARQAARMMLAIHPGKVIVEILKFDGKEDHHGVVVEKLERP
ncbi:hypothetical protein [Paludibacterium yongneupense]|uniref:hypothetical protein n=1 Tax=Paludibacterium yongneupense TaxID=400061 RepID=UPI000401B6D3|nr:hypothetical protein [Paludibacterium yongneupense]